MKQILITAYILLGSFSLFAQSKAVKQWSELQKKFIYYAYTMEDFEKAANYHQQLEKIANKKFKATDSLFAVTVTMSVELMQAQKRYLTGNKILEKPLSWLLAEYAKGTKLSYTHQNYLLLYGNNCYYLADIYIFNRALIETSEKLPEEATARYATAFSYIEEAINAYVKLGKMRPMHPNVNINIATAYQLKGRLQGQFMGNLNACILSLEKSLEYEHDAETYRLLGVANGIAGQHFIAIEFFEKGIEFASEGSKVGLLYNLEVAYRQLSERAENTTDAEKYLLKAETYQMQWKAIDPNYDPTKIKD